MGGKVVGVLGAFVALGAASAWAQDYTITQTSGLMESRPGGASSLQIPGPGSGSFKGLSVALPFEMPYYGQFVTSLWITPYGFVLPDSSGGFSNEQSSSNGPGRDPGSGAFPYTPLGTGGDKSPNADGILSPFWETLTIYSGSPLVGDTYWWTTGTAPNRHFVVKWENFQVGTTNPRISVQLQLFETTGRIVFAYGTDVAGYNNSAYVCGLDSPNDGRFTAPLSPGRNNTGYPGNDFIFDPRAATFTGTLRYDRIVSDASGIGNSVQVNVPSPRSRVELRRTDGFSYASAMTADDGSFTITVLGVPAATSAALAVLAQNPACNVTNVAGVTTSWTAISSLSLASSSAVGTFTLSAAGDPNGDVRGALNVARTCIVAHQWASPRTTDSIPRLSIALDASSQATTSYQRALGPTPASARVGSRAAANPDMWDDAVVTKLYGRHVLASIAGGPNSAYDGRFDAITDAQEAFADGFGYYLWSAVSGSSIANDGTSATTAIVRDLETPAITVPKGPDVSGCVAGALHDLVDPASEPGDTIDGTLTADRAFHVADTLSVAPVVGTFVQAWVDAGYDAVAVTRAFVANGALVDDVLEPNDLVGEASSLGGPGVLRNPLVLTRFNEDWFSVTLPFAVPALVADATYDQLTTGSTIAVEIREAGGALLATGTLIPATGAVHAQTGAVAAGTYKVRVSLVSGGTVPMYAFQVYVPPTMNTMPLRDWTVGRPYDFAVGGADGIAPYTLTASSGTMPAGIGFNSATLRATGTPTAVGAFPVTVQLRDSGSPANIVQRSQTVTIHDVLTLALPPFVAFPAGKPVDSILPSTGGTEPFVVTLTSGALPAGLAFDGTSLHVTGTATTPGSTDFALDGFDVAGSTDDVATRAVVTVALDAANAPADLVAGDNACGWWFDAVQGSTVSFSAKTAKGRARRVLTGAVLAPDRSLVTTASIKVKSGSLSVSKLVCPVSGRYHVIASSADGDATQLTGTVKIAPPKKGKAKLAAFDPTETISIPVGVLPGGTLTLKFAGDKKLGLTAKVVGMRNPAGDLVTFVNFVTAAPFGGSLTATLATGGTWTVILGAQPASGTPGKLSYSYSVSQPKDAVYVAE